MQLAAHLICGELIHVYVVRDGLKPSNQRIEGSLEQLLALLGSELRDATPKEICAPGCSSLRFVVQGAQGRTRS